MMELCSDLVLAFTLFSAESCWLPTRDTFRKCCRCWLWWAKRSPAPATDKADATRKEAAETSGNMGLASLLIADGWLIADLVNLVATQSALTHALDLIQ